MSHASSTASRIGPPQVQLEKELTVVYELFKGLKDPETQQPFFRAGHARRFETEIGYVREGYLSDHPDFALRGAERFTPSTRAEETFPRYVPKKKLSTGFIVYRCLRTSSQLEGYHLHLRETRKASALKAGGRPRGIEPRHDAASTHVEE